MKGRSTAFLADIVQLATDQRKMVETYTRRLAELLTEIHGGEWSAMIDHDAQIVAISRDFNRKSDRRVRP